MDSEELIPICDITFTVDVSDPYCDEGLSYKEELIINSLIKDFNKDTNKQIYK